MFPSLQTGVLAHWQQARETGHRRLMILTGDQKTVSDALWSLLAETPYDELTLQWIADSWPEGMPGVYQCRPKQSQNLLGKTVDLLVFDAWSGLNPNRLLQSAGAVSGGGLIFIIAPETADWLSYFDPEFYQLNPSADIHSSKTSSGNNFIRRWLGLIADEGLPVWCCKDDAWDSELPNLSSGVLSASQPPLVPSSLGVDHQHALLSELCTSFDKEAFQINVITAPRGRGKSYLLGLFAQWLLEKTEATISFVAPEVHDASASLQVLAKQYDTRLRFISPLDAVSNKDVSTSVLLVDEAAGVPVTVLKQLSSLYRFQVLATTLEGYEGTARGFGQKYLRFLNRRFPSWRHLTLSEPMRWREGCPVESFLMTSLLCDTSSVVGSQRARFKSFDTQIKQQFLVLSQAELASNQGLLTEVFSLLATAHYRTSANDLRMLLDAEGLSVIAGYSDDVLVSVALLVKEGPLDQTLVDPIWQGIRRPKGQLIPQLLVGQEGLRAAGSLACLRVIRIAVLPKSQGTGLGSALLTYIRGFAERQGIDLLGSSFGLHASLYAFWQHNNYTWMRLGHQRDKVSGEYAVLVGLALTPQAKALVNSQAQRMADGVLSYLRRSWQSIDIQVLPLLFNSLPLGPLDEQARSDLEAFAYHYRSFDSVIPVLENWLCCYLKASSKVSDDLVWAVKVIIFADSMTNHPQVSGQKDGLKKLRNLVAQTL